MRKLPLALLVLALPATLVAQHETTLRSVQVTAQRRLVHTGSQRTELDSAALRESIAHSMGDILERHSTLFVKSYGRATESTAEFRGTSPSHTQVLWNGMRINQPMLGTVDLSTIPAFLLDGVELLHGASSLTATSGALGGALVLGSLPPPTQGLSTEVIQGVGSYGTYDSFLRLAMGSPRWSATTRAVFATSRNDFRYENQDKKIDERNAEGEIVRSYHPTERNKSGYFTDVHVLQDVFHTSADGRNRLALAAWYTRQLRGLPFLSVDYRDDTQWTNEHLQHTLRTTAQWTHTAQAWASKVEAGYQWEQGEYDHHTTRHHMLTHITHTQSHTHLAHLRASLSLTPNRAWLVQAKGGMEYQHVRSHDLRSLAASTPQSCGRAEGHLATEARWRPIQPLGLAAVMRTLLCQGQGVKIVPALLADYMLYRPWGLVTKASVARNYRLPTLTDLYYQPGGNAHLRPERGVAIDGGVEFFAGLPGEGYIKGNIAAFDSHITDWILWTPDAKGFWCPSNVGRVHSYGVEASVAAAFPLGRHWRFEADTHYAYTPSIDQGEPTSGGDTSHGHQLCYVPRHQLRLGARLHWRLWSLQYGFSHCSERFTTTSNETGHITGRLLPLSLSHASIERRMRWPRLHASARLAVENLANIRYTTVLSRPMAGRNFELFIQLSPQWNTKQKP